MSRLLLHLGCALPGCCLAAGYLQGKLGVDPEKTVIWETGIWAFNLLILVVLLPRAARWARWPLLIQCRRAVGLWTFTYLTGHLLAFITFLLGWDIFRLGEELLKRSYILVGFIAWITLMPLAITSTKRWVQRLGPGWKRLHQSIYIAIALAAVHYLMTVRSDYAWAGSYAMVVILILALRFAMWRQTRGPAPLSTATRKPTTID